jgi:GH43 family beta-xylosidase
MTHKLILAIFFPLLLLAKTWSLDDIRIRDPFIYADPETKTYFMYAQINNRLDANPAVKGVEVYTSKDLHSWEGPKSVFEAPANFWARSLVWAPEMHKFKDKYYLFVTFTSEDTLPQIEGRPHQRKRGTHILVADSPAGPFELFHNRAHTPADWMALDGTLWVEDGTPWMIFCHEWVQIMDGTMELVQLKPDLSDVVGESKTLFKASEAPWVRGLQDNTTKDFVTDGCFLYRTKSDKLLMIWSSFGERNYAIGIAESTSGKVNGPWKQQKELLFAADGGHGMIFTSFDGTLMLVFHQPNGGQLERAQLYELQELGNTLKLIKTVEQ